MTQRIFDVDNPQDVKDLFALLPNKIRKIRWSSVANMFIDNENNTVTYCDFICIAWRDKTEINRPVDEAQLVGKLCWFTGSGATCEYIGVLKAIVKNRSDKYQMANGGFYSYCRPVRRDEVQFVEDDESKE